MEALKQRFTLSQSILALLASQRRGTQFPTGLFADFVGVIASVLACRLLFR